MMTIDKKIKVACAIAGVSESEVARRIETSPQNLHNRLKVGKFTYEELEKIASALGAEFKMEFIFPDGQKA